MNMVGFCAFCVLLFTLDAYFTRTNGVFGLPNVVFFLQEMVHFTRSFGLLCLSMKT